MQKKDRHLESVTEVLMHELVHVIADTLKIDLKEEDVSRFSEALYDTLVRNGFMEVFSDEDEDA